jgi:hypothetical protein
MSGTLYRDEQRLALAVTRFIQKVTRAAGAKLTSRSTSLSGRGSWRGMDPKSASSRTW